MTYIKPRFKFPINRDNEGRVGNKQGKEEGEMELQLLKIDSEFYFNPN